MSNLGLWGVCRWARNLHLCLASCVRRNSSGLRDASMFSRLIFVFSALSVLRSLLSSTTDCSFVFMISLWNLIDSTCCLVKVFGAEYCCGTSVVKSGIHSPLALVLVSRVHQIHLGVGLLYKIGWGETSHQWPAVQGLHIQRNNRLRVASL